MKRTLTLIVLLASLAAAMVACTPADIARFECLNGDRPVYDVPAGHEVPFPATTTVLANGTAIDARGQSFVDNTLDGSGFAHGMKFHTRTGSRDNLCLVGGVIETTAFDPDATPWATWHRMAGLIVEVHNFTVIGTTIRNHGDGIAFVNAKNWKVIGVRVDGGANLSGGYVHDDCIENDAMQQGLVEDSKFDGCNTFMSSDSGVIARGTTVEIRDTLVRLQPYRNSFNVPKYGENKHGGFFKFANPLYTGTPPQLVVRDSTFRADQKGSYSGNVNGFLGLPPGTVCDNVTLIGTEVWKPSDLASWTSQCTNLHLGTVADWNARTAAWDAEHPSR
jgi:hypothetical protein